MIKVTVNMESCQKEAHSWHPGCEIVAQGFSSRRWNFSPVPISFLKDTAPVKDFPVQHMSEKRYWGPKKASEYQSHHWNKTVRNYVSEIIDVRRSPLKRYQRCISYFASQQKLIIEYRIITGWIHPTGMPCTVSGNNPTLKCVEVCSLYRMR